MGFRNFDLNSSLTSLQIVPVKHRLCSIFDFSKQVLVRRRYCFYYLPFFRC